MLSWEAKIKNQINDKGVWEDKQDDTKNITRLLQVRLHYRTFLDQIPLNLISYHLIRK
jgi:hypothetical protein